MDKKYQVIYKNEKGEIVSYGVLSNSAKRAEQMFELFHNKDKKNELIKIKKV